MSKIILTINDEQFVFFKTMLSADKFMMRSLKSDFSHYIGEVESGKSYSQPYSSHALDLRQNLALYQEALVKFKKIKAFI